MLLYRNALVCLNLAVDWSRLCKELHNCDNQLDFRTDNSMPPGRSVAC